MSKRDIRLLLVLSDLHCGSSFGLLPPGFINTEGNEVGQNSFQKFLWKCWIQATQKWLPPLLGGDQFAILLNGDLVDGVHHGTKELISSNEDDHVEAAKQALKPLTEKSSATFLTVGTEVHTKNFETKIGKEIGAWQHPDTGRYASPRISLNIAGTRIVAFHHISATSRAWLAASAYSIFLANEQIEAARAGEEIPRVVCCAHRHKHGAFDDGDDGLIVVSAPWQLSTRFGNKYAPSSRFKTGMILLDWREKRDGQIPYHHVLTLRPPGEITVTL